jgi:hypothetical protein
VRIFGVVTSGCKADATPDALRVLRLVRTQLDRDSSQATMQCSSGVMYKLSEQSKDLER